ncbi:hypothetical protein [Chitiniphilus eburneus]|uniref:Uncharacterized protein n=1 Tax=Chitiniphilus eburneus TaxID=2571148 RepID=A0A4U0Q4D8_9NEIS|nr:hypothetical protein [Chitiniphilus eburneus]TJZ75570.1 hypothetical protein FAZ21_06545 [Chitiniphilus eburneus]
MRYRKLDANGDYSFGAGQADFYRDQPEAVAQAVLTRLELNQGEWFVDTKEGMPWATDVLGKYTTSSYDAAIQRRILGTLGVTEITAYQSALDSNTRRLVVSATISTRYGETTVTRTF